MKMNDLRAKFFLLHQELVSLYLLFTSKWMHFISIKLNAMNIFERREQNKHMIKYFCIFLHPFSIRIPVFNAIDDISMEILCTIFWYKLYIASFHISLLLFICIILDKWIANKRFVWNTFSSYPVICARIIRDRNL